VVVPAATAQIYALCAGDATTAGAATVTFTTAIATITTITIILWLLYRTTTPFLVPT